MLPCLLNNFIAALQANVQVVKVEKHGLRLDHFCLQSKWSNLELKALLTAGQNIFNDAFKFTVGLRAGQEGVVDEERGCTLDAKGHCFLQIGHDG